MNIAGKNILVVGLGKTGLETMRFLSARGANLYYYDDNPAVGKISIEGAQCWQNDVPFDLLVPSPGVPPSHFLLKNAREQGCPLMSEVELAYNFFPAPIIAITGTNGKTTTTSLIGEIFAAAGKKVFVGGNIGAPFIGCLNGKEEFDCAILELSSFQLLYTSNFKAQVALLLNITRDHTDYHGSMAEYARAKGKIFANQEENDIAIINADDALTREQAASSRARKLCFSTQGKIAEGMFYDGRDLVRCHNGEETRRYDATAFPLTGRHNIENASAAFLAAESCNIAETTIMRVLANFRAASHRLELVAQKDGVEFYDDSKGTNVDATLRALESFHKPIVLLLGGRDKNGDFERLIPILRERVRLLIVFGEARQQITERIGRVVETLIVPKMNDAVAIACYEAKDGDVVLLSPACASFDEFSNYQERGKSFQTIVKEFVNGH